jgi:hypothetical protein
MNPMILSDEEFNQLPDAPDMEAQSMAVLSDEEFNKLPDYTPPQKPKAPAKMGKGEAALTGLGEGASLGFGDELAGVVGAAIDRPVTYLMDRMQGVPSDLAGEPEDSTFKERYQQTRDLARRQQTKAKEDQAGAYYGGMLGGALATGVATGGVGPAGLATRGALEGAAAGLGTSEADLTEGEFGGAAVDTALGAGGGAVIGKTLPMVTKYAGDKIGALKGKAQKFLKNLEQDAAMDLLEVTPLVRTKLANKGVTINKTKSTNVAEELPGFLKEQGSKIRSIGALKEAVDEVKEEAGKKIGEIVNVVDDQIKYVLDNSLDPKFYDEFKFDYNNLANAIDEEFLANIRNVPGYEGQVAKIQKYVNSLRAKEGTLSVKELHEFRKMTDQLVKDFSKSPEKMTQYENVLKFVRSEISDHIKDKIVPFYDKLNIGKLDLETGNISLTKQGTNLAKELYDANRNYKMSSEVSDLINKAEARKDARRLISLTDFILGTGTYAVTDPVTAAVSVAGKKGLEYARPRAQLYASEIVKGISKAVPSVPQSGARVAGIMSAVQGTKYVNVFNDQDPQKNAVKHKLLMERDPEYRKLFNKEQE